MRSRSQRILDWYAGNDPAKRSPQYFDRVLEDCLTYYGEDYGHSGQLEKLITVGKTCFDPGRLDSGSAPMLVIQPPPTARVSVATTGGGSNSKAEGRK